jgi:anti-sigma factor RsiW
MELTSEQFELLSAYLDGELTVAERQRVEYWLDHEPTIQRLYVKMLGLREKIRVLPMDEPVESESDDLAKQVFARIDRRSRALTIWGGVSTAIAATCVAVVTGLLTGDRPFSPNLANTPVNEGPTVTIVASTPTPEFIDTGFAESLNISLDRPVVDLPSSTLVDWSN